MTRAPFLFVMLVVVVAVKIVGGFAFARSGVKPRLRDVGVFVDVHLGFRGASRLFSRIFSVTAAATPAAPATPPFIVQVLRGDGLFQRLAFVRLGNGRGFNRVDDFVNVITFIRRLVAEIACFRAGGPLGRLASAAATPPPAAFATALRLAFLRPFGRGLAAAFFIPFHVVLGQYEVVDKIGRYHFICQQLLGRRLGKPLSFATAARALAAALMPSALAAASFATSALFVPSASFAAAPRAASTITAAALTMHWPRRALRLCRCLSSGIIRLGGLGGDNRPGRSNWFGRRRSDRFGRTGRHINA